jgi:hypothetical protein
VQGGAQDIKTHKWFGWEESDWKDLFDKKKTPPIEPDVEDEKDTRSFE